MLSSLRAENPDRQTEAYLFHYDLTGDDLDFVQRVSDSAAIRVTPIRMPSYPFVLFPTRRRNSLAARRTMSPIAYAKTAIDALLPQHVERALLIDADIVVTGSLDELFNMPLTAPLAAASNLPRLHGHQFNSGVVLADIAEWRRRGVWATAQQFLFAYADTLHSHDQHTLNLFFGDDWQKLDLRFNYIEDHFRFQDRNDAYTADEIDMARSAPAVMHYAVGTDKPWLAKCKHPRADLYSTWAARLSGLKAGLNLLEPA